MNNNRKLFWIMVAIAIFLVIGALGIWFTIATINSQNEKKITDKREILFEVYKDFILNHHQGASDEVICLGLPKEKQDTECLFLVCPSADTTLYSTEFMDKLFAIGKYIPSEVCNLQNEISESLTDSAENQPQDFKKYYVSINILEYDGKEAKVLLGHYTDPINGSTVNYQLEKEKNRWHITKFNASSYEN